MIKKLQAQPSGPGQQLGKSSSDRRMLASSLLPPEASSRPQNRQRPEELSPSAAQAASPAPEECGPAKEGGKKTFWRKLLSFLSSFNPKKVFYDRPREDLAAFREARAIRDEDIAAHPEAVRAKIDLKFLGALALSEVAGTCIGAPALGLSLQEATGNAYLGVLGTVVGDYFPAVFTFQAAWLAMNLDFYKHRSQSFFGRVREFYRDVLPIHAAAVAAAIPAYAVGSALSGAMIFGINNIAANGAEKIRIMPIVSEIINFGVVETIYLYLMSSAALPAIGRIAERFMDYLEKRFNVPRFDAAGCQNK